MILLVISLVSENANTEHNCTERAGESYAKVMSADWYYYSYLFGNLAFSAAAFMATGWAEYRTTNPVAGQKVQKDFLYLNAARGVTLLFGLNTFSNSNWEDLSQKKYEKDKIKKPLMRLYEIECMIDSEKLSSLDPKVLQSLKGKTDRMIRELQDCALSSSNYKSISICLNEKQLQPTIVALEKLLRLPSKTKSFPADLSDAIERLIQKRIPEQNQPEIRGLIERIIHREQSPGKIVAYFKGRPGLHKETFVIELAKLLNLNMVTIDDPETVFGSNPAKNLSDLIADKEKNSIIYIPNLDKFLKRTDVSHLALQSLDFFMKPSIQTFKLADIGVEIDVSNTIIIANGESDLADSSYRSNIELYEFQCFGNNQLHEIANHYWTQELGFSEDPRIKQIVNQYPYCGAQSLRRTLKDYSLAPDKDKFDIQKSFKRHPCTKTTINHSWYNWFF